ncbi:MAG: hypothetical protein AAFY71_22580 [Bacteroidota bacterium]
MLVQVVQILVWVFYAYLGIGLVLGIWLIAGGMAKFDEGMKGVSIWMRLILLPGSIAFWPALLKKYVSPPKDKA